MFCRRLVLWTILGLCVGGTGGDDDFGPLGPVVQTLVEKVDQLEARADACDNNYRELKKMHPSVIFSLQKHDLRFSASYGSTIIFDNILLNEGDGYSPRHGEFTAPVSGLYYVNFRGWGNSGEISYMFLKVNERSVSELPFGDASYESASSQSVVVHLTRGDVMYVSVETRDTVVMLGRDRTTLMGYLILAD